MILMAAVNANYEFIISEFGMNGRISDGGVIENTNFYNKLKDNTLQIPGMDHLSGSDKELNYVFIGDETFSLTPNFLKPFNQRELTTERKIFNYRLSRARRVVESAFGILANRFKIFHTSINLKLETIDIVVITCCALHNFLRRKYSTTYTPNGSLDYENTEDYVISTGLRTDNSNLIDIQKGHFEALTEMPSRLGINFYIILIMKDVYHGKTVCETYKNTLHIVTIAYDIVIVIF